MTVTVIEALEDAILLLLQVQRGEYVSKARLDAQLYLCRRAAQAHHLAQEEIERQRKALREASERLRNRKAAA